MQRYVLPTFPLQETDAYRNKVKDKSLQVTGDRVNSEPEGTARSDKLILTTRARGRQQDECKKVRCVDVPIE